MTDELQLAFVGVGGLGLLKSFLFAAQNEVRSLSVNLILNLSAYHGMYGGEKCVVLCAEGCFEYVCSCYIVADVVPFFVVGRVVFFFSGC